MRPWVENYHPRTLKDVVGNVNIIKKLGHMVDTKLQNLIITGFSGCGKSSSIFAIIRETGAEHIELNASDERNISTIRSTIKTFAMKKSVSPKIIVLEEIDNMPKGSQHGIASLMETTNNTCFILTCNDYNKIIENLTSRCMILKFQTIEIKDIVKRLTKICRDARIKPSIDVLNMIAKRSQGDLRKAINLLQTCYLYSEEQSMENLNICSTEPSSKIIQDIILSCSKQDFDQAKFHLDDLLQQGYDCTDVISFLFKECSSMNLDKQISYLKTIGEAHVDILHGGSKIQLYSLLIKLIRV